MAGDFEAAGDTLEGGFGAAQDALEGGFGAVQDALEGDLGALEGGLMDLDLSGFAGGALTKACGKTFLGKTAKKLDASLEADPVLKGFYNQAKEQMASAAKEQLDKFAQVGGFLSLWI